MTKRFKEGDAVRLVYTGETGIISKIQYTAVGCVYSVKVESGETKLVYRFELEMVE